MGTATEILTANQNGKKAIEKELGCKFLRIDPDKEDSDILELSMKYLDTLNNRPKNTNK